MGNVFATAARLQTTGIRASFAGASHSRLYSDWGPMALHPDREMRWALRDLRARARDLVRNNPYAAGIVESIADNVIGWDGIAAKPKVTDPLGNLVRSINWEIESAWREWDAPEYASADGYESWHELQRLIVKTWATDGEVFIRHRRGFENRFGYAVQLLDADLVDETFERRPDDNGVEIRMGVEIDRNGKPLAYHMFDCHPSEGRRERKRVPATEIEHFFIRYRPGQTRGFTMFAPVLTTVKMIDGLTEAELTAARVEAAKMGFIVNKGEEAIAAYAERLRAQNANGEDVTEPEPRAMEASPGLIEELIPGQEFQGFDPTHPNTAFEPFLKVMMLGVARGVGMSYLTTTGDVSAANYSSMRAGLIPERDRFRVLQVIFSKRVHRPVYRNWLSMALLSGELRGLPTRIASDYYSVEWRGRGWKWVDPVKDLLAAELAILLGLDSRQRLAAEQGRDFEVVVDEIADEQEYAAEQGVYVGGSKGKVAVVEESDSRENRGDQQATAQLINRLQTINGGSSNGKH